VIDESRYVWTVDKAKFNGHFYSDKPMPLSICLTGVYAVLHRGLGLSFAKNESVCTGWITRLTIGVASAALAGIFCWVIDKEVPNPRARLFGMAALAFSPVVFSAIVVNPHTVAASTLFSAYAVLRHQAMNGKWGLALGGGLIGFSVWLDPVTTILMGSVAGLAYVRARGIVPALGTMAIIACGFSLMIVAGLILNRALIGQWLPFYLTPSAYDYPGSFHGGTGPAATSRPDAPLLYAFHCLFGRRGLFLYSPALIFGMVAPFYPALRRDRVILTIWAGCGVSAVYFCFFTADMGGWWYGFRFLFACVPFLALMSARVLDIHLRDAGLMGLPNDTPRRSTVSRMFRSKKVLGIASVITICVSMTTTIVGLYNPTPICREGVKGRGSVADYVASPFLANAVCIINEYYPGTGIAKRFNSFFFSDAEIPILAAYLTASYADMGKTVSLNSGGRQPEP